MATEFGKRRSVLQKKAATKALERAPFAGSREMTDDQLRDVLKGRGWSLWSFIATAYPYRRMWTVHRILDNGRFSRRISIGDSPRQAIFRALHNEAEAQRRPTNK